MTRAILLVGILAALCAAGCSSETAAAAPVAAPSGKTADLKGAQGSGATPGINPGYHSNAAADDAKIGAALNGKK